MTCLLCVLIQWTFLLRVLGNENNGIMYHSGRRKVEILTFRKERVESKEVILSPMVKSKMI